MKYKVFINALKKTIHMHKKNLFLVFISTIIFTSCDFVGNPYPETNANIADTASCPTLTFPAVTASGYKKILLEDYTGHTCGNCPRAADTLQALEADYPGKIIPLALHVDASGFAAPAPGHLGTTASDFLDDYRTLTGEAYDNVFGACAFGLPAGMFNRKDYPISDHIKFYLGWRSYLSGILSETATVDLQIAADYDPSTRKICFATKDSFLTGFSDTLKLVVLLTQDSIVGWQDVYGVPSSTYVFNHMLKDAITPAGTWGESLVSGAITAGTTHIKKFAYTIPANYNSIACDDEHVHLIAFIYRTSTYEILQAEEIKLIP